MNTGFSFTTRLVIACVGLFIVGALFGIMIGIAAEGPITSVGVLALAVGLLTGWRIIEYILRQLRERDQVEGSRHHIPPSVPSAA